MVASQHSPAPGFPGRKENLKAGLALLREALDSARHLGRDAWDFAVEIRELRAAGLNHNVLRWLLCMSYAEHAEELFRADQARRSFRRFFNTALTQRSCFVLTARGALWAADLLGEEAPGGEEAAASPPRWDGALRRLYWNNLLVKQFRLPAPSQETILAALEEEGWPPRIDDPLPPTVNCESKARLHDAIKGLNRNQVHPLLHFGGDGTGEGVVWDVTSGEAFVRPRASPVPP